MAARASLDPAPGECRMPVEVRPARELGFDRHARRLEPLGPERVGEAIREPPGAERPRALVLGAPRIEGGRAEVAGSISSAVPPTREAMKRRRSARAS